MTGRPRHTEERNKAALNHRLINAIFAISSCATFDEAFSPLLNAALDLTNMDGGGVYSVEDKIAVLRCHRGLPEAFILQVMHMPLAPLPVQTLLSLREPVELAEISPTIWELCERHGIRHAFSFPLRARDMLVGFLNVGSTHARAPRKDDIRALHLLVHQMGDLFWRLHCEKALRESEVRYRMLAETAHDLIFVLDREARVQYVNQYCEDALGLRKEEILGRLNSEFFPPETAARQRENVSRVVKSGESLSLVNCTQFGDKELWLMTLLTPIRNSTGEIEGVLGISRDITEQKHLEQELRRLNEELEIQVAQRTAELSRRAGQLKQMTVQLLRTEERERRRLAEILHDDLQQMLAAAGFRLSLTGSRTPDAEKLLRDVEQVREILREATRKCRTLSHELGPPALYGETFNGAFEWLARQMATKHGLVIRLVMPGSIYSNSEEVKILLFRASQEILFNVAKHAGVMNAELRLRRTNKYLWLTISDKGHGFDPALVPGSAGFGLLSIRERVEFLGGQMEINSAPGQGSSIRIILPDSVTPAHPEENGRIKNNATGTNPFL